MKCRYQSRASSKRFNGGAFQGGKGKLGASCDALVPRAPSEGWNTGGMSTVTHYSDRKRFIAEEGGREAGYLEYEREANGSVFVAMHVVTDPEFRGRGIAGEVTAAAFEHARRAGIKVKPVCPYVQGWVEKNPQVKGLLAE